MIIDSSALLKKELEACNIHADRIQRALNSLEEFLPLSIKKISSMSTQELAITELLTARFAKLQDTIGEKIFPLLLLTVGEDIKGKSFIDRLNLIEKLGYIENAEHWFEYRQARNAIAHEYPDSPEINLKNLEKIIELAKLLLAYWHNLNNKIKQVIN